MAEWISRTVQYFIGRPDVQLVIRVHPGEVLTHGQSMADVVQQVLPRLPDNIRLIRASDEINTYDLIEVADVGLVYTTTVGLEMAMMGLPVVVAGQTHYRERGFTYDPDSWVTYFKLLGHILENPAEYRLSREQVNQAWQYAYRFFFDYPQPFPWHLVRLWEDYQNTDLKTALTGSESEGYRRSFRFLAGEPVNWDYIKNNGGKS
jgi:capsule polysaccharide export protein KpsC/LpsZ